MEGISSRQRLLAALNHQEADRFPIDLGGTPCTSITLEAYDNLRQVLGLESRPYAFEDLGGGAAFAAVKPHPDIYTLLNCDIEMVGLNDPDSWQLEIEYGDEYDTYRDEWGCTLYHPKGGHYFDYRGPAIPKATLDDFEKWTSRPNPLDPGRWRGYSEACQAVHDSGRALASWSHVGGGIFEQPGRMMPLEEWLMATAAEPLFTETILNTIFEIYYDGAVRMMEEVGDLLDVFVYWDDLSTQNAPMVSPRWFQKYLKPLYRRLFDLVKSRSQAKIFFHCCGAARTWIPDLIDVGVDALNPVQTSAVDMDPASLKREFGQEITFWGGTVNPQGTLFFGTPQQVRDEARRSIEIFAPGGGFVFAGIHNILDEVPPENIAALFETALEYVD